MSEEVVGKVKEGRKSTEFYILLAVAVVSGLTAVGLFTPANCGWAWCAFALQGLGLVSAVATALGYLKKRSDVKSDAQKALAAQALAEAARLGK